MSTTNVTNSEIDILSIVRELEGRQPQGAVDRKDRTEETRGADPASQGADPSKLLESLQKKRELINMIDGYTDVKDMGDMKNQLNAAIEDLEEILEATA